MPKHVFEQKFRTSAGAIEVYKFELDFAPTPDTGGSFKWPYYRARHEKDSSWSSFGVQTLPGDAMPSVDELKAKIIGEFATLRHLVSVD